MGPVLFSILISQVAVLDFTEHGDGDPWLPARLSDLVALKLRLLGIDVRDRHFARSIGDPKASGLEASVWGRVRPREAEESDPIAIEVKVKRSGDERSIKANGRAGDLDRIASDIAIEIGRAIGRSIDPKVRPLLEGTLGHPFAVQNFLGRAERRLESGDHLQATLMFDRAGAFANRGAIPEAMLGRHRTEGQRVAKGSVSFGSRADLAAGAAERAAVAMRDGNRDAAARALTDVLRYSSARALRWSAEIWLGGPDRAIVVGRDKRWLIQSDVGPDGLWALHPPTGAVLSVAAGRRGLVGAIGNDLLALEGRTLARTALAGAAMWKVSLPLDPIIDSWDRGLLSQGSFGLRAKSGVVWIDVGLGTLGQVAPNVEAIAQSPTGILIRSDGEIGLLRPGKKTPAWKTPAPSIDGALLTVERAIVLAEDGLHIFDVLDGRSTKVLAAPKLGTLLRAYGRFACVGADDGVHLYDVLAGEKTAVLIGPSRAIDCSSETEGVSVLYESGDLLFFNREGKLIERARAPGRPQRILRNSPIAPGPVVVTDRGLFAFAEVAPWRDVDAIIELAQIDLARDRLDAARRLADWVALTSAGQIAKAERLRAAILRRQKYDRAAARAEARARAAEDPSMTLPPFALE